MTTMKCSSFFSGLLLIASFACLIWASPASRQPQELSQTDIVVLANKLPWELRVLYDLIIDLNTDDIRKENYIWHAFELLKFKKYQAYIWFYDWLVYQSGYDGYGPGRHTPRHGGHTPRGGHGGRTRGHGHGGPGRRTPGHGGPGRHTPRGGRHHHGRH
ncbi:uncharacterized protein LOC119724071 [Patiria miniata]|uniref:Uncharacterized protein n=1 Tax=Patiria miniata TaxID=46514 RepID=A0A913ZHP8_PATMI|nr:uncharacterized protein LOC119724071 [Patiria miniata]